ncbi:Transporter [Streptococcus sp. ZB199]|nr:Transporter [Streptococcus sp. ZB199]
MFKFKDILAIIFGAGIFSFGIYFLVIPFHFYEGGATGITLITYYLFKIPVSIMNLLINIPLFVLAWKLLGKKSLYLSLLGPFRFRLGWLFLKPCPQPPLPSLHL